MVKSCKLAVTLLLTLGVLRADAHSWYPGECCSNRDCMPADRYLIDQHGDRIVTVGADEIWVSRYQRPRPSPDGRVHICYRDVGGKLDGTPNLAVICLFVPAES